MSVRALFPSEVLVTASASTSSAQRGGITVLDPAAAAAHAPLVHWKGVSHPARHGVACVPTNVPARAGGTGGCIAAIEPDKAVLTMYSWQRDQPLTRIVLPQKMTCVSLAPHAAFVATGTGDGRLFVWEVATGALLASWEAHYRAITSIAWTSDAAALVTASDDTRVCVWSWPSVLGYTDLAGGARAPPAPYATLADHTLDITDVHVSSGAFPQQVRVWTASRDGTLKAWDLATRQLTSTYAFDGAIAAMAVDALERFVCVALGDRVYRLDLFVDNTYRGGHGARGATEHVHDAPSLVVPAPATALALSTQSSHLAVGTQHGSIHLVDVPTLQTIRTLSGSGGGSTAAASASASASANAHASAATPITFLHILPAPADLATHTQLRTTRRTADPAAANSAYMDDVALPPIAPHFARTLAAPLDAPPVMLKLGDAHGSHTRDIHRALTVPSTSGVAPARASAAPAHAAASAAAPAATAATATGDAAPHALEAKVRTLEAQVQRAKALNDQMWQRLVQSHAHAHSA